ncbi:MAG TPA: M14 family zinc carboxypeptidase [Gaiellaceae bacterium]
MGRVFLLAFVVFFCAATTAGARTADPAGRRTIVLGHSVDGRVITAVEIGDFDSPLRTLVVGCIHGNEPAGIAIAQWLTRMAPPSELDLWIVSDLNPDGVAANTRQNAHHVDLNRNFPFRWRPLSGYFYSGPRALSEPESRIAYRLISRVRPQVAVWFHQHLDVVDESGGSLAVERRFAALVGLPLARLTREPGSAIGWENHVIPSGTAFAVELPAGALKRAAVDRFAHAIVAVSKGVAGRSVEPRPAT